MSISETRLNTSGWFNPAANSSSGNWIRVAAVSNSGGWIQVTADLGSGGWIRVAADIILRLTWVIYFNISSKFKDLFCKIHHLYGLFSTNWFQLPLIQALAAASRILKKLEEASKLYLRLILVAAADSSCDGWFETWDQSTTSRVLTPMPSDIKLLSMALELMLSLLILLPCFQIYFLLITVNYMLFTLQ